MGLSQLCDLLTDIGLNVLNLLASPCHGRNGPLSTEQHVVTPALLYLYGKMKC